MEQDIRLNIHMGMSLENIIEEMLLNMEAYNYEPGEEEDLRKMATSIYHQEFSKFNFDDFLNMFLGHQSDEHGNYYPQWSDEDYSLKIVSEEKEICTDQVLLDKLSKYVNGYSFKFVGQAELEIILLGE